MSIGRGWIQALVSWIQHGEAYSAMYPANPAVFYGESAPGMGVAYLLVDLLLPRDWAVSALIALFLAASAFGVYSVARALDVQRIPAFCGGFFFATSNFVFANIDDSIVLFWLLPLLAVRELVLWMQRRNGVEHTECGHRRTFIRIALLLGIQLYFSVYLFLYGVSICGVVLVLALWHCRAHVRLARLVKQVATSIALLAVLVLPWLLFYLYVRYSLEFTNPFVPKGVTRLCSLNLTDLVHALPGNRIRPEPDASWTLYWSEVRRHAYLGFVPISLAVVGLFRSGLLRRISVAFALVGLFLSTAPTFSDDLAKMTTFISVLQEFSDYALFMRVPLRGYFLTGIGVALLAASGLQLVGDRFRMQSKPLHLLLVVPILAVHLYDNVPSDAAQFKIANYATAPEGLVEFGDTHPDAVIAQIPSELGFDLLDSELSLFRYSRELVYLLWQSDHGLRTVNGVNGYAAESRVAVNELLSRPITASTLAELHRDFGVTHLVVHRDLRVQSGNGVNLTDSGFTCLSALSEQYAGVDIYEIELNSCDL
jgi:hypothetical protein